ncbi:hypothetical protein EDB89DRAFT_1913724 [Lactarius sanguifluus]|nr:hypothetical protein EDB89DRAFT_1913724 [Lactarius sanguifluus]
MGAMIRAASNCVLRLETGEIGRCKERQGGLDKGNTRRGDTRPDCEGLGRGRRDRERDYEELLARLEGARGNVLFDDGNDSEVQCENAKRKWQLSHATPDRDRKDRKQTISGPEPEPTLQCGHESGGEQTNI